MVFDSISHLCNFLYNKKYIYVKFLLCGSSFSSVPVEDVLSAGEFSVSSVYRESQTVSLSS